MTSFTTILSFLCGLIALTAAATPVSKLPPFPSSCAIVLCPTGTRCFQTPTAAKCVPIKPCLCATIFDPVCCKTPTGLKTVSSSCVCQCGLNNTVVSTKPCLTCANVRCREGYRCIEATSGPKCEPITACRCTEELNPVCCKLPNGNTLMKSNPCLCTTCIPDANIVAKGACLTLPPVGCFCPTIFQPVCCQVAGFPKSTASNACQCRCRRGTVVSEGKCENM